MKNLLNFTAFWAEPQATFLKSYAGMHNALIPYNKRIKKILLALTILAGSFTTGMAQQEKAPASLGMEFVCELKVTTDKSMVLGPTSHGERRIVPITGGTFEGPNIKGTVLNGGADYQFVNKDNTRTEIEAIYNLKTDDGVVIHIRNVGVVYRTKEQTEAIAQGKQINWEQVYFRAAPTFNAPQNSKYDWLNNALFVSRGIPSGGKGYVTIQVWKIL